MNEKSAPAPKLPLVLSVLPTRQDIESMAATPRGGTRCPLTASNPRVSEWIPRRGIRRMQPK
jgi:hypothetical protein